MAASLKFSEHEFETTTPRFFFARLNALNHARQNENDIREFLEREAWERARLQTWYLVQIQLEKKDRQEITRFLPFPWDPAPKTPDIEKQRELIKQTKWATPTIEPPEPKKEAREDIEKSFLELLKEAGN